MTIAVNRELPSSGPPAAMRIRASILATLAGWALATLYSLIFQLPLLWRNAPPGGLLLDLLEGFSLWAAFTLAVCTGVWCVVVLPLAIYVPPAILVRRRWTIPVAASACAVLIVGWRIGTWVDMFSKGKSPSNPILAPLFLEYSGFGAVLAFGTTLVYTRLLLSRSRD